MILRDIPTDLLEEHPENSNFMDQDTLLKLRRHIEQSGRYEPLTVRPHPWKEGRYQLINGHNRLRVLRSLSHPSARCVVWNLDDDQTRLYLATLNRLSGHDIPERRAALLENLLASFSIDELSLLLPDDKKQLEELEQLSRLDLDEISERTSGAENTRIPVFLSFLLEEEDAKQVNLSIDLILSTEKDKGSRGQALVRLARFYLGHHKPIAHE